MEIAGVLIAIGFIAACLTAGGLGSMGYSIRGYSLLPARQMEVAMDIPAERVQQMLQRNAPPSAGLAALVVKGEITTRNPNALEAKHAMQRRLEMLVSYVSQQGGSVTLGEVRYFLAREATESKKAGEFVMVQQIEIRLPDSTGDPSTDASAYANKLIRLGIRVNSVERIAPTSAPK